MPLYSSCLLAASHPDSGCARLIGGSQHPTHEHVNHFPSLSGKLGMMSFSVLCNKGSGCFWPHNTGWQQIHLPCLLSAAHSRTKCLALIKVIQLHVGRWCTCDVQEGSLFHQMVVFSSWTCVSFILKVKRRSSPFNISLHAENGESAPALKWCPYVPSLMHRSMARGSRLLLSL